MKHTQVIFSLALATMLAVTVLPTGNVLADADVLGPLASNVAVTPNPATVNTTVTITALLDDSTTGASNIKSAEYSVDGGAWLPMSASDGAFDAVSEAVTATFVVTQAGDNQVCVRGTDALDNVGDAVCASLTGQYLYQFAGFLKPVRMTKSNTAKAARTVPVKWKLTMQDGSVVKDRASFVALKSYEVDCTTLSGDISTAVEEKSAGKSGLKKIGKEKWRFNWKTPKSYRQSCRMMFVLFSDGQMSPEVLFRFK